MATSNIDQKIDRLTDLVIQGGLAQKAVLTLPEAAIFTGRSQSNLYKLSSEGRIPCRKPEGKMLYFDRLKLEAWMLRNPIRTTDAIEQEAVSRVAFGETKPRVRKAAAK